MPSTASPILRIQLMGTGDQAGTWGDTTNTNLGSLLEGAIAGLASVSVSSTAQALVATDYAADQARMAIISLSVTGAVTTPFTVYAPPVSKTYIIRNTSAYDATIRNATAANGTTPAGSGVVVIPAGRIMQVWSNGTDFFKADTAITLSTDVTGTLPVANGGTGATTFSSGQFLKGAGTGAVTTAATVALASEVSGTLPVANGGTGVTTSTGTGSVVLSTSPTLTTPTLGVASATSVAAAAGAVSTPSFTATGDTDTGIWFPALNTIAASVNGTEAWRTTSNGDFGIGITPTTRLHVSSAPGSSCLSRFTNSTTTVEVGVSSAGGGQAVFGSTTNHLTRIVQNSTTQLQISTAGLVQIDNGYGSLATFYGCRAWINFNGTGTPAIRGSGNVSSITDNGTGDYTINFTVSMPDANYAAIVTSEYISNGTNIVLPSLYAAGAPTATGSVRVYTIPTGAGGGGMVDATYYCVAIFR